MLLLQSSVSSNVMLPGKPKTFGTLTLEAHPDIRNASMRGKSTRIHAPASMRRRQRGSLSRQAGRQGIAANRTDSATEAAHSGHFPSRGWARRSYPQQWHARAADISSTWAVII
jgi:hypothetical protein